MPAPTTARVTAGRQADETVELEVDRLTAHYANNDYTRTRVMARVRIRGDRPRGPSSTPHTG